ncbi:MAG TPA: putative lipid II flippase FtsW [Candidatus Corynebacterium avicola]|uniref:Probable peptidoglycan glycosyltransferase FtsW n=1 Tax=Candidatus Corynebacterium avicola TaxID=2838527 RepID=A0A9D1RTZ6_9CORY|nr:putative lipid II flippase FtsW [Candidatus Corynebacterium avicola]
MASPQLNYKVIMTVTVILVFIGLTMVLSSSMVTNTQSVDAEGISVFTEFLKQALVVAAGLVAMWVCLRVRPDTVRRSSPFLLLGAFILLILVLIPGIGVGGTEVGSNSWIRIGGVGIQPSEIAKFAIAVWGSAVIAARSRTHTSASAVLAPFVIVSGVFVGLVILQNDLGMMLSLGSVMLALIFFAGANGFMLGAIGLVGVAGAGLLSLAHSFRSSRFSSWYETFTLTFSDATSRGASYQSKQGIFSLADGGLIGHGLGQSRAKYYLPEAANDFVFAIIGEELGLVGAGLVVLLFGLLAWFGLRTAMAQADPFLRLLAAALTMGIVIQAFYNMGYVVGLFPMTGVQLPLISAGGSSAVVTLASLGLLASIARHEPKTISSMQHEGRPLIDRLLFLSEPRPYTPGQQQRERVREQPRRYGEPVTRRREPVRERERSSATPRGTRGRGAREAVPPPRRRRSYDNQRHRRR